MTTTEDYTRGRVPFRFWFYFIFSHIYNIYIIFFTTFRHPLVYVACCPSPIRGGGGGNENEKEEEVPYAISLFGYFTIFSPCLHVYMYIYITGDVEIFIRRAYKRFFVFREPKFAVVGRESTCPPPHNMEMSKNYFHFWYHSIFYFLFFFFAESLIVLQKLTTRKQLE